MEIRILRKTEYYSHSKENRVLILAVNYNVKAFLSRDKGRLGHDLLLPSSCG